MSNYQTSRFLSFLLASAAAMAGCAEKPTKAPDDSAVVKTLKSAEQDARMGNEAKAVKEIDAAEQALVKENKEKPYPVPNKRWSGEDPKASADSDAIKELEHARRDAERKLPGEASDEVKKAIKDVEIKESR